MFNFELAKHRDDFVKFLYDILKVWVTLSIITPLLSGKFDFFGILLSLLTTFFLLLTAVIFRQGGE